jgi:hypothetical protein
MNLIDGDKKIVKDLLSFEHTAIAEKLGFISNKDKSITNRLLVLTFRR